MTDLENQFLEAAQSDNILVVINAIEQGIDVNVIDEENFNYTALHWACAKGSYDVAEILIENSSSIGLNVNMRSKRQLWTPLMNACAADDMHGTEIERRNNRIKIANLLLDNAERLHLDINAMGDGGQTALSLASYWDALELAHRLKDMGAAHKYRGTRPPSELGY